MDQPKMERLLRLMKLMSGSVNYSLEQLSRKLDMSERTIYRYIDTFKESGFVVTRFRGNVYKLGRMPKNAVDIDKLIYFSEEEAYLVNSLISSLAPSNSLKANLRDKLSAIYDSTGIAGYVDRRSSAAHVEVLGEAIKDKKKVYLKGYESGHSHSVRDRWVEPYAFTTDYIDVCAYDLEDGQNKIFKIQRIGEVELTGEPWTEEASHRSKRMDIFRMSGEPVGHLRWRMTVMAKNLLLEEFPLSERDMRRDGNCWILDTDVCNWAGACRFYVGLAGEIKVLDSPGFEEYVKEYVKENLAL